jgi:uncharacterized Zn finger protein
MEQRVSRLRQEVRDHINNYYRAKNMMSLGLTEASVEALIQGSGEALARTCYPVPTLKGNELEKYAQAIEVVNDRLSLESDGIEDFEP